MRDRKLLTLEDARELLLIDKNELDVACAMQPQIFEEVAYGYSMAVSERDNIKEDMAVVDAEIAFEYRSNCDRTGTKITENKLKEEVQMHKKHKDMHEKYMRSRIKVDEFAAIKESFYQRVEMLKKLADLYAGKYWEVNTLKQHKGTKSLSAKGTRKLLHRGK